MTTVEVQDVKVKVHSSLLGLLPTSSVTCARPDSMSMMMIMVMRMSMRMMVTVTAVGVAMVVVAAAVVVVVVAAAVVLLLLIKMETRMVMNRMATAKIASVNAMISICVTNLS